MANRLANASSPYLKQHENNPVDWHPWSEEAFASARAQDKAIFLSVGYSACHWCHVMERESFENEDIAAILNKHFISIKVDREERPDVDQIYMQAVQMLTGSGGWPMSVFMSPDGRPFYGGTYWPPDNRWGRPGFGQVLNAVADAWKNKRAQIEEQSEQITEHLRQSCRGPSQSEDLSPEWLAAADAWLQQHHDDQFGGFGGAPKFPHAMDLSLLIELDALEPDSNRTQTVRTTLDCMFRGGIYDHVGGGFARYSVDERWLVPHFEKMLYDNALLAAVYADAYRLWEDPIHAQVVQETLDYVIRDMTNSLGGYHSTEDADSEGVEGKFYVWQPDEIQSVLGQQRGAQFCQSYDVTPGGNFEGSSILNLRQPIRAFAETHDLDFDRLSEELREDRAKLLLARAKRVRPGLDDKVLLSWNGLMVAAMVKGYRALGDVRFLESAQRAIHFVTDQMQRPDGRFWHTWRAGTASLDAYLDDYACLLEALVELFQVDCKVEYLTLAIEVAETLLEHFRDPEGGFFFTAHDHEQLIARSKDLADSSVPSGNSMAASALLTLARICGRDDFQSAAQSALSATSGVMASSPQAAGQALRALNRYLKPSQEFTLALGTEQSADTLARSVRRRLNPLALQLTTAGSPSSELQALCPHLVEREPMNDRTTLYICTNSVCQQPLSEEQLDAYLTSPET